MHPHPRLSSALLALVLLAAGACCLNDTLIYTPDSANYLAWARSLAVFRGFSNTLGPDPSRYVVNAPLYALILAPVAMIFPYSVVAAKCLTLCLGVVLLLLFHRFLAARVGAAAGLAGTVFLLINPLFILYSTQVLSEIPFGICVVLSLLLADRATATGGQDRWTMPALVTSVCAGIFLREVGFALLGATVLFFALRKEYRRAFTILLVPLLLYLLWFTRNELIVAAAEHPALRNSQLLFSHFYTGDDSSFAAEVAARISGNVAFYLPLAGAVVFYPQFVSGAYSVVVQTMPAFDVMRRVVDAVHLPVALFTFVVIVYGARHLWKSSSAGRLTVLFLLLYIPVILFYPIDDARFLFPLLLVGLYAGTAGCAELAARIRSRFNIRPRIALVVLSVALAVFALPNLVWLNDFGSLSISFSRSPDALYASLATEKPSPREFETPFHDAGEWIARNSDSAAMILSRYMEVGLWTEGRKVITEDPYIPLENFEPVIRDYGITHVVSTLDDHLLRDFQFQMTISRHYRFAPVWRRGDLEVLRVYPAGEQPPVNVHAPRTATSPWVSPEQRTAEAELVTGLQNINAMKYPEAVVAFSLLGTHSSRLQIVGNYLGAMSEEFAMALDTAEGVFGEFRSIPQAGSLMRQAQYHLSFIGELRAAAQDEDNGERAALYRDVSVGYWQLGFRRQALAMLSRALDANPQYLPGHVLGVIYRLELGDTAGARFSLRNAESTDPGDQLVRSLDSAFALYPLLARQASGETRAGLELSLCRLFAGMGLFDLAIDRALDALRSDPANADALRILARLYTTKERYAPALRALTRYCLLRPEDDAGRKECELLEKRW